MSEKEEKTVADNVPNNVPSDKEIVDVIRNLIHIAFGTLPKTTEHVKTNLQISEFLDKVNGQN